MPRRVLFLPLVLSACAAAEVPCASFEQTTVSDVDKEPAVLEAMQAALDEFAGWTTREGVCVDRITTTHNIESGGKYAGDVIYVDPTKSGSVERTVKHELCHAWDRVSGDPSLARPDLFPPETVHELEQYPTTELRIMDAFARACAKGPRGAALAHLDAELCDEPFTFDPAQTWLREHVYDGFVADLDARVDRAPMTITRTPLWTLQPDEGDYEFILDVAPAGNAIAVIWVRLHEWSTYEVGVRLIDPATATVTADFPLPIEPETGQLGLLSTDGAPILWVGSPLRAWRLDPESGAATLLPLPDKAKSRIYGHVFGDTAWVLPYSLGERNEFGEEGEDVVGTPFTVNLTTGAQDPLPRGDDSPVKRIVGNGDLVSVHVDGRVDTWSFGDSTWSTTATTSDFQAGFYAPLPDGRLATVSSRVSAPVVLDAEGRTWTFPDQPCGAANVRGMGPHLTLGDDMYVVTGGVGDTVDLVRVQF